MAPTNTRTPTAPAVAHVSTADQLKLEAEGNGVGFNDGLAVTPFVVGEIDVATVEVGVGAGVGRYVGSPEGAQVGGDDVGDKLGVTVGKYEGECDGDNVGEVVGMLS